MAQLWLAVFTDEGLVMTLKNDRLLWGLVVASLASAVVFTAAPGLDLWTSSLFFGENGFALEQSEILQSLRTAIWNLSLLVPIGLLGVILAGFAFRLKPAVFLGPLVFMLLGPGLVVNGILKSYWGRARPANIAEFGGSAQFSPPLTITDQCLHNCSFVSGEAAGIVAASLVIFYLLAPRLGPSGRLWLGAGLVVLCLIGSGMRVMMGRHFLSDVIFAALFMMILFHLMQPFFQWCEGKAARGWCLRPPRSDKA